MSAAGTDHPAPGSRAGPAAQPGRLTTPAGRRAGYAGSFVISMLMLTLVNWWPGWEAVPFLTTRTVLVIGAVNASIIARAVADLVNLVLDLPRVRALGDIVALCFGLFALVRIWQVFPLEVSAGWETVTRVLLVLGFVGSAIGIIEAFVRFVRGRFPRV